MKLISYHLERDYHLVGNQTEVRSLFPRGPKRMFCTKMWSFCLPLMLGWYSLIKCNGWWKTAVFSYMPSQLTSLCKRKISGFKSELLERQISIHEVLLRMNSITKVSHGHGLYFTAFNQISIRKWYLYRPLPWHWHSSPRFKSIGWSLKLKLTSWWEM